jgi:hypothetical protein
MEEDDMVMREAVASEGRDEPMREARGAYKEVPRASRRLALATPESPWDVHPCKGQNTPYTYQLYNDLDTRSLYRERLYGPIFKSLLTITYTTLLVLKSTAYTAVLATY